MPKRQYKQKDAEGNSFTVGYNKFKDLDGVNKHPLFYLENKEEVITLRLTPEKVRALAAKLVLLARAMDVAEARESASLAERLARKVAAG